MEPRGLNSTIEGAKMRKQTNKGSLMDGRLCGFNLSTFISPSFSHIIAIIAAADYFIVTSTNCAPFVFHLRKTENQYHMQAFLNPPLCVHTCILSLSHPFPASSRHYTTCTHIIMKIIEGPPPEHPQRCCANMGYISAIVYCLSLQCTPLPSPLQTEPAIKDNEYYAFIPELRTTALIKCQLVTIHVCISTTAENQNKFRCFLWIILFC